VGCTYRRKREGGGEGEGGAASRLLISAVAAAEGWTPAAEATAARHQEQPHGERFPFSSAVAGRISALTARRPGLAWAGPAGDSAQTTRAWPRPRNCAVWALASRGAAGNASVGRVRVARRESRDDRRPPCSARSGRAPAAAGPIDPDVWPGPRRGARKASAGARASRGGVRRRPRRPRRRRRRAGRDRDRDRGDCGCARTVRRPTRAAWLGGHTRIARIWSAGLAQGQGRSAAERRDPRSGCPAGRRLTGPTLGQSIRSIPWLDCGGACCALPAAACRPSRPSRPPLTARGSRLAVAFVALHPAPPRPSPQLPSPPPPPRWPVCLRRPSPLLSPLPVRSSELPY